MRNHLLQFFILLITCTSCMSDKLPKYSTIESLRILALIAANPEVDAGGSTSITPIISDINETNFLSFEAKACIPTSISDSSCAGNSTSVTLASGNLNSGDMTRAKYFTGAATAFTVNMPASSSIFQSRSTQDQFNGLSYLVTYTVTNSSGTSVSSFRRIIASTRNPKNQNPVLNDLLNNGGSFGTSVPTSEVEVSPSFGAVTSENFQVLTSSGDYRTDTEELVTTWFATDGNFKYTRTLASDKNLFTGPESSPTSRDAFIIAIVRDGRGGIAYKKKCFGLCP